jgi:hypothetical protein
MAAGSEAVHSGYSLDKLITSLEPRGRLWARQLLMCDLVGRVDFDAYLGAYGGQQHSRRQRVLHHKCRRIGTQSSHY